MKNAIARSISAFICRRPKTVAATVLVLTLLSTWRVTLLHINHNQMELIPQNLPAVRATKQLIDMTGTVGFLLIPLIGKDLNHVKAVADELAPRIAALPEIKRVTYTQDVAFVRERMALFVKTPDLKEAYKRIRKKIRAIANKNNPFAIELSTKKDTPLDLSDILRKYTHIGKKDITDPYYVDINKEAVLLVIKPNGLSTDQVFLRHLMIVMNDVMQGYNAHNNNGAVLKENYGGFAAGATITYGYTGGFKTNLDDSESLKEAIIPTGAFALVGILLYLLYALRRPSQIAIITGTLILSVLMSFAACEIVIGELNTITAVLAAILMGLGIDYGIHFMYRFREEFSTLNTLEAAIERTLLHSGSASFGAATTTAASLYILTTSEFRGFSDFGIIAGTGVLLSFALMYVVTPTVYVLMDSINPRFKDSLRTTASTKMQQNNAHNLETLSNRPFPFARPILIISVLLTGVLSYFATQVRFNYDTRALLGSNRPSIVMQEEINHRWTLSSDPVGIFTTSLAQTEALFKKLTAQARNGIPLTPQERATWRDLHPDVPAEDIPKTKSSSIESILSLYSLVPPADQQQENRKILDKLEHKLEGITKDSLDDPRIRDNFDKFRPLLSAQPFTLDTLPPHITAQFRPIKKSTYFGKGYLTWIYPKTSLWNGEEVLAFANEVGTVRLPALKDAKGEHIEASIVHGGGIAVVFADLARIVLDDGVGFALFSALAIFLIAWADFRSIKGAAIAMLPLMAGVICMLGLMAAANWRINFMNIVVFPLVFGYGISAGVHVYHRFSETGSVMVAVRRTGGAILASSVTTLIGWAAMLISGHRGLASMGVLACFGIASTLLVSLTTLPALLQITQDRQRKPMAHRKP